MCQHFCQRLYLWVQYCITHFGYDMTAHVLFKWYRDAFTTHRGLRYKKMWHVTLQNYGGGVGDLLTKLGHRMQVLILFATLLEVSVIWRWRSYMWPSIGKHVLSKTAFLGRLKRLTNGVWQRFKRHANSFQTVRKLPTNACIAFQTIFKHFANASQTVCKAFQTPLKPFSNGSETLRKRFANPFQTVRKPSSNGSQTLYKRFSDNTFESRRNSGRNNTRL